MARTETTHETSIRTRSTHSYLIATVHGDEAALVGYAVNSTTAAARVRKLDRQGRPAAAARIVDGVARFVVTTTTRPGAVIDGEGKVVQGTVTRRSIAAAEVSK